MGLPEGLDGLRPHRADEKMFWTVLLGIDLEARMSLITHPAEQKGPVAHTLYAVGLASSDRGRGLNQLSFPLGLVVVLPVDLCHLPAWVRE